MKKSILFLFFLLAACSSPPEKYIISGKILRSAYTPAVTDVSLILGNDTTVDPSRISKPDQVVKSDSSGKFSFTLTNNEYYYNGVPRVMGIYAFINEMSIFLIFRPSSVKTDLGYLTMWDSSGDQWVDKGNIVFNWNPPYEALGMGSDRTLFTLYCGNNGSICWKSKVDASGKFSLPISVFPYPNYCWNLSASRAQDNKIYSFTTSYSCGKLDNVYPDLLTDCTISVDGIEVVELNDENLKTFFSGGSAREIDVSCTNPIVVGTITVYDVKWSPDSDTVTMGVFLGNNSIAQFEINEGYGYVRIDQSLSNFSLRVIDEGVYINSLAEVRVSE